MDWEVQWTRRSKTGHIDKRRTKTSFSITFAETCPRALPLLIVSVVDTRGAVFVSTHQHAFTL